MHGHCPQKLSLAGSLQLAEKELQKRPPMHATRPDFPLQARRMLEHHWGLQLYLAYQRTGTQLRKEAELRWFRWHVWLSCGQMWIDRGLEVRAKMCRHSKPGQKCYHHVRHILTQNENELHLLNPSSHMRSLQIPWSRKENGNEKGTYKLVLVSNTFYLLPLWIHWIKYCTDTAVLVQ